MHPRLDSEVHPPHRRVSIVVPMFNEEDNLLTMIAAVERAFSDIERSELILVDDGSTDETYARSLKEGANDPKLRVVRHGSNQGIGAALRSGVKVAKGSLIVVLDADLSYEPSLTRKMVSLLEGSNCDVVVTSPYAPGGHVVGVSPRRAMLSRWVNRLYRIVIGGNLTCYTSMVRVYRRGSLASLAWRNDRFESQPEILALLIWRNARVLEIPATLRTRRHGLSKSRVLPDTLSHLRLLVYLSSRRLISQRS